MLLFNQFVYSKFNIQYTMKEYMQPSMKVKEIALDSLLAVSSFGTNDEEGDGNQLGNNRRGLWGDLWDNGEEK